MSLDKAIKDALKDVKVGDSTAISIVEAAFDKAEAKDKVQKANEELTAQRKEWEVKEKEYKSKNAELESKVQKFEKSDKEKTEKISVLEKEKLTPEEREKLKASEALKADMNQIIEEVKALKEDNETQKNKRIEAEKASRVAILNERKQAQKTAISTELSKHKIIDGKNAQAMHVLFGDGWAKLEVNDDGTTEEKYYTKNSEGELVTSTLAKTIANFAENNKFYVAPSGNIGTGQNHNRFEQGSGGKFETYKDEKSYMEAGWDE